jgi:hypothetical protein
MGLARDRTLAGARLSSVNLNEFLTDAWDPSRFGRAAPLQVERASVQAAVAARSVLTSCTLWCVGGEGARMLPRTMTMTTLTLTKAKTVTTVAKAAG